MDIDVYTPGIGCNKVTYCQFYRLKLKASQRERLEDELFEKVPKSSVKITPLFVYISRIWSKFSYAFEK